MRHDDAVLVSRSRTPSDERCPCLLLAVLRGDGPCQSGWFLLLHAGCGTAVGHPQHDGTRKEPMGHVLPKPLPVTTLNLAIAPNNHRQPILMRCLTRSDLLAVRRDAQWNGLDTCVFPRTFSQNNVLSSRPETSCEAVRGLAEVCCTEFCKRFLEVLFRHLLGSASSPRSVSSPAVHNSDSSNRESTCKPRPQYAIRISGLPPKKRSSPLLAWATRPGATGVSETGL